MSDRKSNDDKNGTRVKLRKWREFEDLYVSGMFYSIRPIPQTTKQAYKKIPDMSCRCDKCLKR